MSNHPSFPNHNPITDTNQTSPVSIEVSAKDESTLSKLRDFLQSCEGDFDIVESITEDDNHLGFVAHFHDEDIAELMETGFKKLIETENLQASALLNYDTLSHPGNVYIRGLARHVTVEDLKKLVLPFGGLVACKVVIDPTTGQSKGFGFVNFENGSAAKDAINKLNGTQFENETLYLNRHISKKERMARLRVEKANFKNLYVKNIPSIASDEEILQLFEKYGNIESYFLPRSSLDEIDESNGGLKGYGFIKYTEHNSALSAMEALNNFEIHEHKLSISRAQRREERNMIDRSHHHYHTHHTNENVNTNNSNTNSRMIPTAIPNNGVPPYGPLPPIPNNSNVPNYPVFEPYMMNQYGYPMYYNMKYWPKQPVLPMAPPISTAKPANSLPTGVDYHETNLYVTNLPYSITDETLIQLFDGFGEIISAKIMTDSNSGKSRGFGFVCFATSPQATNALVEMNEKSIDGHKIQVSFAQRKDHHRKSNYSVDSNNKLSNGQLPPIDVPNGYNPMMNQPPSMMPQMFNPYFRQPIISYGGQYGSYRPVNLDVSSESSGSGEISTGLESPEYFPSEEIPQSASSLGLDNNYYNNYHGDLNYQDGIPGKAGNYYHNINANMIAQTNGRQYHNKNNGNRREKPGNNSIKYEPVSETSLNTTLSNLIPTLNTIGEEKGQRNEVILSYLKQKCINVSYESFQNNAVIINKLASLNSSDWNNIAIQVLENYRKTQENVDTDEVVADLNIVKKWEDDNDSLVEKINHFVEKW